MNRRFCEEGPKQDYFLWGWRSSCYEVIQRFMCALRVLNFEREQWTQKRMCEILFLPPSQPSAPKENSLCGVYARLQRKEGKQAACLSGSRAPSACWDQLVLLRHRNAVVRLEVSWTARRQTRQARHRGFVESGSTAVVLKSQAAAAEEEVC